MANKYMCESCGDIYFNLTALKKSYPIYECHGIQEALRTMTPEWND